MSKQDRQGVRKASDIEQKYNLGGYEEVLQAANEAKRTADVASTRASNALSNANEAKIAANEATNAVGALTESVGGIDKRVKSLEEGGGSGATFIPSVSADGVISWTNNGGLENPAPVNLVDAVVAALPDGDGVSY